MRTSASTLLLALLIGLPGLAAGQTSPAAPPMASDASAPLSAWIGELDFGGRVTSVSGDPARYQRLRDLRSGPTVDRLRYRRDTDTWLTTAEIDHAGYRDQRYSGTFQQYGRWKGSFEWNQVPLFYSTSTRTPFTSESPGVFRLDDATQRAVQTAAATTQAYVGQARPFDLRSRRDTADVRFAYSATPEVDFKLSLLSTARTGAQPMAGTFGQNVAVELPVPIDQRTNDLNLTAEWSNARGMAKLAYDASWFNNGVESLVWDSPLTLTDAATAGSQGRMPLWPDSTAHTVSAAGSVALPARSRAFGYVSVGSWLQDQALLPYTINTAIAPIPLARQPADAEARIVSMNYRLTSRPSPMVWLNGQFRVYDYDNRTPHFAVGQFVRADSAVATSATGGSEPFGYVRHFLDLDASFTPLRHAAFRLGYGRERDERTFRLFEETTEQVLRAAIDSTGLNWGSVRLQYEHAVRTGKGLDEEVLGDIGEQVSLRQFDISDRTRDRVTAIVQFIPVDAVGLNGSVGIGQESRPDAAFGLQDNDLISYTVGMDLTPGDAVNLGATYGFERYTTLQRSRQANPGPQFDDPTRDWSTDMDEQVHTVTGRIDLPQVTSRTAASLGYDYVRSNARYLFLLPANTTLVAPQQLPPVRNEIQRVTADLRHTLTRHLALGIGYAYDKYDVEDFALSPGALNSPVFPALFSLMYQWLPYNAHTGSVRIIYRW